MKMYTLDELRSLYPNHRIVGYGESSKDIDEILILNKANFVIAQFTSADDEDDRLYMNVDEIDGFNIRSPYYQVGSPISFVAEDCDINDSNFSFYGL